MANMEWEEKEEHLYEFVRLPENIRQVGEQTGNIRFYIEDYVITYLHRTLNEVREKGIVIFVGKRGVEEAANSFFLYGAVLVSVDMTMGERDFSKEKWDELYEMIHKHFSGSEILGWGTGVSMWNSCLDQNVRELQRKKFAREESFLFLEDFGEKEEKVFHWKNGELKELSGYLIYYDKNPRMQDYMLGGKEEISFEAEYQDDVTKNIRKVIQKKEEKKRAGKKVAYGLSCFLFLLTILGTAMVFQSTQKIETLEKTIQTLSNTKTVVNDTPCPTVMEQKTHTSTMQNMIQGKNKKENAAGKAGGTKEEKGKITVKKQSEDNRMQKKAPSIPLPKAAATVERVVNRSIEKKAIHRKNSASYIVKEGDTLGGIVWRQYHTFSCMEMVKKVNRITDSDKIEKGRCLLLPAYHK